MTLSEASMIYRTFGSKPTHTEEETFLFIEACEFLIEKTANPRIMMQLGGFYYEQKDFDLALKYYEMAMAHGFEEACECLGYIWYYGRTGITDYAKAFECFNKGMLMGNIVCAYKLADMYKNGYGIEKNYDKYVEIITEQYKKIEEDRHFDVVYGPGPEIYSRMGGISKAAGDPDDALEYYWPAKGFLQERMMNTAFFGNFTIMRYLVKDIFSISEFNPKDDYFDVYDLYYLEEQPFVAHFDYMGRTYEIHAERQEDGTVAIEFEGRWYRSFDKFLQTALLCGKRFSEYGYYDLLNWEVEY